MRIKMTKGFLAIGTLATFLILSTSAASQDQRPGERPEPDMLSEISQSGEAEGALKAIDDALSICKAYDDYERFVSNIKNLIQNPDSKNIGILHYAIAKARIEQLAFLSKDNAIESGRLYMSVNDQYYNEALESLDAAAILAARSKEALVDINFLKLLIFKEKFQPQKEAAALNEMVDAISQHSDDPALNKIELSRASNKFKAAGYPGYSVDLMIAYASKVDRSSAQEIFEEIRKSADQYFLQGNMKEAQILYERYVRFAHPYFEKDIMAAKVMEIAEKYYAAARYSEARYYYEFYTAEYSNSKIADYSSYKIALCLYYEKDYAKAIERLENFISSYQTSVWFDKAFESLACIYYVNFPNENARQELARLIDKYYRKNVGDYAEILIGLLYYRAKDYDNATSRFKKVDPTSVYLYAAQILKEDARAAKKDTTPSFGSESNDAYKIWEPDKPISVKIVPVETEGIAGWLDGVGINKDQKIYAKSIESGVLNLKVKKNTQIKLRLAGMEDWDKFAEYLQDRLDQSRLPKKIKEDSEKDLVALQWTCDGGKFLDEKQTEVKAWQAPENPGVSKISVRIDDLGLVRLPDKGARKDSPKELMVIAIIED